MEISVEIKPEKRNFFSRNIQVFQMAIGLAVIFLIIIFISLFLKKTRPTLVPVDKATVTQTE